ncbi:MAG TPA: hypothetical protein VNN13_03560 [Methylomirabilota bacterium]|nr:hypothetical protein [Methylomirabilota bacterium]
MKRMMLSNLLLGLWLMLSPFALVFLNKRIASVLWEDLLLGFGIATFALCVCCLGGAQRSRWRTGW